MKFELINNESLNVISYDFPLVLDAKSKEKDFDGISINIIPQTTCDFLSHYDLFLSYNPNDEIPIWMSIFLKGKFDCDTDYSSYDLYFDVEIELTDEEYCLVMKLLNS